MHSPRYRVAPAQLNVGEQGAERELPEARRQQVERRRRIGPDAVDVQVKKRRGQQRQQRTGEPPGAVRGDQNQREDEVELLLDGQRPEVGQRSERGVLGEVAGVLPEDEIRGEGRGRSDVLAERLVRVGEEEPAAGGQRRHEHEHERGEEAQDAAAVEPREGEAPRVEPRQMIREIR